MTRALAVVLLLLVTAAVRAQASPPPPPPPATGAPPATTPVAKTPPATTPVAKTPPATTPAARTPPATTMAPKTPPANTPPAKTPAAKTPAAAASPPTTASVTTAAPSTAASSSTSGDTTRAPSTTTIPVRPAAKVATKKRKKPLPPPPPPAPAAELFALNTHESFKLRPDAHGRITQRQLQGWSRFLRCHHTGRVHAMSTRLAQLIYDVAKHFDFKRIFVVAGYRAPRVAREKGNPKSPHKKGVACDFRIDGVANTELRDFERTLPKVGVGYYPNSDFVHLDVDPLRNKRSAFWIDYSRPGERARYSKNPSADLQAEHPASGGDEDDELAPFEFHDGVGGGEPQIPGGPGAVAPNLGPVLAPSAPNP